MPSLFCVWLPHFFSRRYNRLVVYLQGSVHNPLDLERAAASSASSAFILSPPPLFSSEHVPQEVTAQGTNTAAANIGNDATQNDSAVLLAAMSLRVAFPELDIYAQVALPLPLLHIV